MMRYRLRRAIGGRSVSDSACQRHRRFPQGSTQGSSQAPEFRRRRGGGFRDGAEWTQGEVVSISLLSGLGSYSCAGPKHGTWRDVYSRGDVKIVTRTLRLADHQCHGARRYRDSVSNGGGRHADVWDPLLSEVEGSSRGHGRFVGPARQAGAAFQWARVSAQVSPPGSARKAKWAAQRK